MNNKQKFTKLIAIVVFITCLITATLSLVMIIRNNKTTVTNEYSITDININCINRYEYSISEYVVEYIDNNGELNEYRKLYKYWTDFEKIMMVPLCSTTDYSQLVLCEHKDGNMHIKIKR